MTKDTKNKNLPSQQAAPSPSAFMFGIVLIGVGILLFIAILSFFFTGGADRSIFDISFVELLSNTEINVQNPLGKVGAWISDMVVTNGVGVMALWIPLLLVICGLYVLGIRSFSVKKYVGYALASTIWGSIAFALLFYKFSSNMYPLFGGAYGYYAAKWLVSSIGIVGTVALLLVSLFVFVARRMDSIRLKVVQLLQKIHIKVPHIQLNADEGETIEPVIVSEVENKKDDDEEEEENDDEIEEENNDENDEESEEEPEEEIDEEPENEDSEEQTNYQQKSSNKELNVVVATGDDEEEQQPTKEVSETTENEQDKFTVTVNQEKTSDSINQNLNEPYDPTLDLENYEFPYLDLLNNYDDNQIKINNDELNDNKDKIVKVLEDFKIEIDRISATVGPTVTLYEIKPASGVRISAIQKLNDDIAMNLAAPGIRIIAPIPNKDTVGIEVPNSKPQIVSMRSVLKAKKFQDSKDAIPIAIGKTISNETFVFDLAKTPHLLVAGATGQGKSVCLNAIITSILYRKHPSELKFVLIDPKTVEFSIYKVLEKHYLAKMGEEDAIVTDTEKVKSILQSLTIEMDARYKLLAKANVRNIKEYNAKFISRHLNPSNGHRFLPYIVVIIDEFADLKMVAGKEVEMPIARIAQKARAIGIHIILATQRPSADIITGVIKANFPSRIAFKVASSVDSKTILDSSGAQHLIGRGDMLIQLASSMSPTRVQCAFVDTPEVEKVTDYISHQQSYPSAYELPECSVNEAGQIVEDTSDLKPGKLDPKIREIAQMVVDSQIGSTSNIQRQFDVGFNRAGRIMDQLERMGIVSRQEGSKPRVVYIQNQVDLEDILSRFGV